MDADKLFLRYSTKHLNSSNALTSFKYPIAFIIQLIQFKPAVLLGFLWPKMDLIFQ